MTIKHVSEEISELAPPGGEIFMLESLVARYSCMNISPPGGASSEISSATSFPGHYGSNGISYMLCAPQDTNSILEWSSFA